MSETETPDRDRALRDAWRMELRPLVARGVALLDEKAPEWRTLVKQGGQLTGEAMSTDEALRGGCGCVLGRTFGDIYTGLADGLGVGDDLEIGYLRGLGNRGIFYSYGHIYGFSVPPHLTHIGPLTDQLGVWDTLADLWWAEVIRDETPTQIA